jgi:oligoendopeptidase F
MIIQTILLDPSGAVWTDEASNVSRPDPSGAIQVDAEHPSRNRLLAAQGRGSPRGSPPAITRQDSGLLDVGARPGKARGAFCSPLPHRRQAIIFMTTTGGDRDLTSLAHETGHAFAMIEAGRALPLLFQREVGNEIGEMAAMAMELLVSPFLHRAHGGFYDDEDHRRSSAVQLERIVDALPRIAAIDAMQHWIYTDPAGSDRDSREQQWLELCGRFMRGADWSGLEDYLIARWHTHAHFFLYPFHYIEYGFGQVAALQIWRNSLHDRERAVRDYRRAVALGNIRTLPEVYRVAGSSLIFDEQPMRELIGLVERQHLALC